MKKGMIVAMMLLGATAQAQQVNYTVIKDDPTDVNTFMVTGEFLTLDMGFKNLDGFAGSLGANAYASIKNRLGAEAYFRYGLLSLTDAEKIRKPLWLEGGVFLNLTDKTKTKNTKVVLMSTSSGNTRTEYSISPPANRRRMYGVRAGINLRTFPFKPDDLVITGLPAAASGTVNGSVTGIYAGVQSTTIRNLFINTDAYGARSNSNIIRYYLDVMIFPIHGARYEGKSYKDSIMVSGTTGGDFKYNPIGWRFGLDYRPAETRRKREEGRARPFYVKMEFGSRPLEGGFFTMGIGWTFIRRKSFF